MDIWPKTGTASPLDRWKVKVTKLSSLKAYFSKFMTTEQCGRQKSEYSGSSMVV